MTPFQFPNEPASHERAFSMNSSPGFSSRRLFLPRLVFLICLIAGISGVRAEEQFDLVIVYPGGPNPGSSGQRVIDDFVTRLNEEISFELKGTYFNEIEGAATYLKDHPNSFVFGSTGFFLASRKEFNLVPELTVILPDEKAEQYFLVSKKGSFADLSAIKGEKIAGSPFFEATRFLNRIVFGGEVSIEDDFETEPTSRPLSALRDVSTGEMAGVLLAAPQYYSLAGLPLAEELDVVFQSEPIASVGFMRVDNPATASAAESIKESLVNLSRTPEGAEVCKGFGVAGFADIEADAVAKLTEIYDES